MFADFFGFVIEEIIGVFFPGVGTYIQTKKKKLEILGGSWKKLQRAEISQVVWVQKNFILVFVNFRILAGAHWKNLERVGVKKKELKKAESVENANKN